MTDAADVAMLPLIMGEMKMRQRILFGLLGVFGRAIRQRSAGRDSRCARGEQHLRQWSVSERRLPSPA
jgi:hypothetical protein